MVDFKFPTIEEYIRNRKPYTRQKPIPKIRKKSSTPRVKLLCQKDLRPKTPNELLAIDIRKLHKSEFTILVAYFALSYPKEFKIFLRKVLTIHIADLEKENLKKYFKKFKQKVRYTGQTVRALKRGESCTKKCKWCPLKSCVGGSGKNKLQKLEAFLRKPL